MQIRWCGAPLTLHDYPALDTTTSIVNPNPYALTVGRSPTNRANVTPNPLNISFFFSKFIFHFQK